MFHQYLFLRYVYDSKTGSSSASSQDTAYLGGPGASVGAYQPVPKPTPSPAPSIVAKIGSFFSGFGSSSYSSGSSLGSGSDSGSGLGGFSRYISGDAGEEQPSATGFQSSNPFYGGYIPVNSNPSTGSNTQGSQPSPVTSFSLPGSGSVPKAVSGPWQTSSTISTKFRNGGCSCTPRASKSRKP